MYSVHPNISLIDTCWSSDLKIIGTCVDLCVGIIEPIKSGIRDPKLGIGKQEEDDFFTAEENIQRKKLDIELEETEENAKKREVCHFLSYS